MCQWWVFVLFLFVFWGWRAMKDVFYVFCLPRKRGLKSMSHLSPLKCTYVQRLAMSYICMYWFHPLCVVLYFIFHCEFLPFLRQLFLDGTGFILSITLQSSVQFLPGLILCQAYPLFAIAKMVSSHTYPASNLTPNNQHKRIKKINFTLLFMGTKTSEILY